jgi:hypothetical protein
MFIEIVVKHQKNLNTLLFDFGPSFRLLLPNVRPEVEIKTKEYISFCISTTYI